MASSKAFLVLFVFISFTLFVSSRLQNDHEQTNENTKVDTVEDSKHYPPKGHCCPCKFGHYGCCKCGTVMDANYVGGNTIEEYMKVYLVKETKNVGNGAVEEAKYNVCCPCPNFGGCCRCGPP